MKIKQSFITNSSSVSFIFKTTQFKVVDVAREFFDVFFDSLDKNDYDPKFKETLYDFLDKNKKFDSGIFVAHKDQQFGDHEVAIFRYNEYILCDLPLNSYGRDIKNTALLKSIPNGEAFDIDFWTNVFSCDPKFMNSKFFEIINNKWVTGKDIEKCHHEDLKEANENIKDLENLKDKLKEIESRKKLWHSSAEKQIIQNLKDKIKRTEECIERRKVFKSNNIT